MEKEYYNSLFLTFTELLDKFAELSECPTDDRLKEFLSDFKDHLQRVSTTKE